MLKVFAGVLLGVVAGCPSRSNEPPGAAVVDASVVDPSLRELTVPGRFSPQLTALFTPRPPFRAHYAVYTLDAPLDRTRQALEATYGRIDWRIERVDPLDAFDSAARFDRWTLPRLYGGVRPLVALGHLRRAGQAFALTVISPHPDEGLRRLRQGTMIVVFAVPTLAGLGEAPPQ